MEDGRLDLDEALPVEIAADGRHGFETDLEHPPGVVVHDEVDVAPARFLTPVVRALVERRLTCGGCLTCGGGAERLVELELQDV